VARTRDAVVSPVTVASIADHPDAVDAIGRWHFELWGHVDPGGTVESWTARLRRWRTRDQVPTIYVAVDGDVAVGSTSLVEHDMTIHRDLTPWVAGVYVVPERRGEGIGSALVRHVVAKAAEMGIARLYLYTGPRTANGFYKRLGWREIRTDFYEGAAVSIMQTETGR
jgi:GNAT superfamily N-acetyltransferase